MADPRSDVLAAMRQKGNETQLTRAIWAIGQHDPQLVARMARAILATAAEAGNKSSALLLKQVPESLTITKEDSLGDVRIGRRRASGGRLDWQMTDGTFRLAVEVKIGATAAPAQLERYLDSFSRQDIAGGLILLTRATEEIPTKVSRHARWLGQVRWDQVIHRLGKITPPDPTIKAEWTRLLAVIRAPGDLADPPVGWQLAGRTAGERNRLVLAAVRDAACSTVAVELAAQVGRPTSDGLCGPRPGPRTRSVVTSGDWACLGLYVPARTQQGPAIEIHLTGTRKPLKVTTYVDPGFAPKVRRKAKHAESLRALSEAGFTAERTGDYEGWYVAIDRIAPVGDTDTPESMLWACLEARLKGVVASGTLNSLVR